MEARNGGSRNDRAALLRPAAKAFVELADLLRLKHRARGFSFMPRQPVHSLLVGRRASRLRGRGLDFEELRHYFIGDDPRTIDWLATARLGSPHIRVFTEERDRPVLLVVDQRSTMFFGSRRAMKSVAAAETAALAAWRVTSLGDRVGAIVFNDAEISQIEPKGRGRGVVGVLGAIVRFNQALAKAPDAPVEGPTSANRLNDALRRADAMAKHDWLICLISDAAGADGETRRLVTKLTMHSDVIAVFVSDGLEAVLPDLGLMALESGGRQIEIDSASSGLRQRFAKDFIDWRTRLASLSRDRGLPIIPVSTDREVADQLRELIGRRSRRQPRRSKVRRHDV